MEKNRTARIIQSYLEEKGLQQKDLAAAVSLPQSTVSAWNQRDRDVPSRYLLPIAQFLNVGVYELLGAEEPERTDRAGNTAETETMTIRIVLKSGESLFVNCTEFTVNRNALGQCVGYKIDGITSGRPLYLDLSQVAAIVRI